MSACFYAYVYGICTNILYCSATAKNEAHYCVITYDSYHTTKILNPSVRLIPHPGCLIETE